MQCVICYRFANWRSFVRSPSRKIKRSKASLPLGKNPRNLNEGTGTRALVWRFAPDFVDGLIENSRYEYELVTMAARFWKWRLQGGAQTLARKCKQLVESGFTPDVVLASSMVNIPAFLALSRKFIGNVPVVYYLHENQLTYPLSKEEKRDLSYAYINYLSCLRQIRLYSIRSFTTTNLYVPFPDYSVCFQITHICIQFRKFAPRAGLCTLE